MNNLYIGTKLKATDPCNIGGIDSLIVGKEYPIKDFFIKDLIVESETDNMHFFGINDDDKFYYKKYFEVVEEEN